jgi:catechol 2,3-dioxygenase-like lactoylglutathione lyase family enzyme
MAFFVDANQNQQWVQRNGSEGVGCHAIGCIGRTLGRNYSYASGELAQNVAKVRSRDRSSSHFGDFEDTTPSDGNRVDLAPSFRNYHIPFVEGTVVHSSILQNAKPAIIICTRDRERATRFYRDTLGLALESEDKFAAIFRIGAVTLRISLVPDFVPHAHTVLGFLVSDVRATVQALRDQGVTFQRITRLSQDELGIWTAPGGAPSAAWFPDPDGNLLSVSNA